MNICVGFVVDLETLSTVFNMILSSVDTFYLKLVEITHLKTNKSKVQRPSIIIAVAFN